MERKTLKEIKSENLYHKPSLSSNHAASTDFPDSLSLSLYLSIRPFNLSFLAGL